MVQPMLRSARFRGVQPGMAGIPETHYKQSQKREVESKSVAASQSMRLTCPVVIRLGTPRRLVPKSKLSSMRTALDYFTAAAHGQKKRRMGFSVFGSDRHRNPLRLGAAESQARSQEAQHRRDVDGLRLRDAGEQIHSRRRYWTE